LILTRSTNFLLSVTTKKVTAASSNNASFIFGAKTKVLAQNLLRGKHAHFTLNSYCLQIL
jgi:hypothetical protein